MFVRCDIFTYMDSTSSPSFTCVHSCLLIFFFSLSLVVIVVGCRSNSIEANTKFPVVHSFNLVGNGFAEKKTRNLQSQRHRVDRQHVSTHIREWFFSHLIRIRLNGEHRNEKLSCSWLTAMFYPFQIILYLQQRKSIVVHLCSIYLPILSEPKLLTHQRHGIYMR